MTLDYAATPTVTIDGLDMARDLEALLERVVVDDHLHLPDMFAIHLRDADRDVLGRIRASIGSTVRIAGTATSQTTGTPLIEGEVTALEGEYEEDGARLVIRGYDLSHRFVSGRHTETYRDVTDADVARTIADRARVSVGQIDETDTTYPHVSQANVSDWDFLTARAREIGYEVGVRDGRFFFRRPAEASAGPAAGDYRAADPLQLVMGTSLISFYPRLSGAQQVREVEVRGWDPVRKEAVVGVARATTRSAQLSEDPQRLAEAVGRERVVLAARPLSEQGSVDQAAAAEAERIGSTSAEAEGVARGHPDLRAGAAVSVSGVGDPFNGRYIVTHTRHVFDEDGYRTHFVVSGRQDRSLLGLTSMGATNGAGAGGTRTLQGLAIAIVTDNDDPDGRGRVKLEFPTLDDGYESDWCRVAMPGAGGDRGLVLLPEIGDEVLVGFESGDIRRPYVIGGLWNGQDAAPLGDGLFDSGAVQRRGLISRLNHRLVFLDEESGSGRSGVALLSGDGSLRLSLRQSDSTINVHSDGSVSIVGSRGVTIQTDGDLSISASGNLELEAGAGLSISAGATVDIDGALIELN